MRGVFWATGPKICRNSTIKFPSDTQNPPFFDAGKGQGRRGRHPPRGGLGRSVPPRFKIPVPFPASKKGGWGIRGKFDFGFHEDFWPDWPKNTPQNTLFSGRVDPRGGWSADVRRSPHPHPRRVFKSTHKCNHHRTHRSPGPPTLLFPPTPPTSATTLPAGWPPGLLAALPPPSLLKSCAPTSFSLPSSLCPPLPCRQVPDRCHRRTSCHPRARAPGARDGTLFPYPPLL